MKKATDFKIVSVSARGNGKNFRGENVSREEREKGYLITDDIKEYHRDAIGWILSSETDRALQKLSGAEQLRLRQTLHNEARWRGEI